MGVRADEVKTGSPVDLDSAPVRTPAPDLIAVFAVVGIAVAASLGLLPWLGKSMFADEGATLYSAHLSWSNLWAQSRHVDLVLLPYYVLVHFWSIVSANIAFVRALSLLAFFGTIVAAGTAGLRLAGRWCGIIAAVLTATSTLLVLKALNARPYELSALLVTLGAIALFKWLEDPRPRWIWAFSVLSLLATAMQLFSLLAPFSMLLCLLLVRPKLLAQRLRALAVPIAILAVVSGAWIAASIGEVGQVNWIASGSSDSRLSSEVRGPLIGVSYDFVLLVVVVVVLAKLAAVWNRDVRSAVVDRITRDREILAVAVGWTVLPTAILSAASFIHPIYANRYVAASAPGAALLVAFVVVRTFPAVLDPRSTSQRTSNRRGVNQLAVLFGTVAAIVLVFGYMSAGAALQEDLQGPSRYVAQHEQIGDVIALPDHAITAAVDSYLAGDARLFPHWPQLGVRQRYVEGFDLSLHPAFSGSLPRRVWLVTDGSVPGIANFQQVLDRDGYVLSDDKQFSGVSLLLFTRRS